MKTDALLGEPTETNRGFPIIQFDDAYGCQSSIQCSSAIDDTERGYENPGSSYVWLGIDDAQPKILASKAREHGVETVETCGWVPFPVPDDVLLTTRMHLSREHVAELIPVLQRWLDTGKLA